jgi:hypothetical protein
MNAGGVPNTCKSSGKASTGYLNDETGAEISAEIFARQRSDELHIIPCTYVKVEKGSLNNVWKYTSGGRLSNT